MSSREKLSQIADRFRKPNPERLAWEYPLRLQLVWRLLIVSGVIEVAFLGLEYSGVIRSAFFPWAGFESLLFLIIGAWYLRRGNVRTAASILLVSLSHVAGFTMAAYGPRSAAPALLIPTIIICGLVIGGYVLAAWSAVCAAMLIWISVMASAMDLQAILFWIFAYIATAYLVWLFSSHLERLLEAAGRSGEERQKAIIEERLRLAREIHDTLAQGFTGVVVQINAAEQVTTERAGEAWEHLDQARSLARRSLDEARRSILLLRSNDLSPSGLLAAIGESGRHLLTDASIQLETVREGQAYALPAEVETELLRVGQEAVANAIQHSGGKTIRISLSYLPDQVMLRVSDDGSGLFRSAAGFGIRGMEERMRRIRGHLEIVAQPERGTTVCAGVHAEAATK